MRIQPSSTINLYSGVDIDMGEQLAFSSIVNQRAYFESKLAPGGSQHPCTMVRKTGMIRIEVGRQLSAATLKTCNYISFVNPDFDNKEVYARILDYDYVNNETVDIAYGIDYWQTWMFDVTFKDSYIEREHLSETLFNLAESNPYDIHIPEFRTAETLPINGETEKYYYDIAPDANDHLSFDGFKIGKLMENTLGATGKIGVLLKLGNIDFEDLDSVDDKRASGRINDPGELISTFHTVDTFLKTDIPENGSVLVSSTCPESNVSVIYKITRSGVHINPDPSDTSDPYIYPNPCIAQDTDNNRLYEIKINDATTSYEIQIKFYDTEYVDWYRSITSQAEPPGLVFVNLLKSISDQTYGYWQLPYGTYKYLRDTYDIDTPADAGSGWVYGQTPMTPFGSNEFKNKCIYIYDENGGGIEGDEGTSFYSPISTLLRYLTLWDCVSSIVSMFAIPNNIMLMSGSSGGNDGAAWAVQQKSVKTELSVTNKKLMLYPFSYLRLVMPNGDVKELHFEDFLNVRNGGDVCELEMLLDISDCPILTIAPYQYKMGGMSNKIINDCNIKEAIFFKQFPTAPYIIDAYLAQVSNYSREVLKSNTLENLYNYATDLINTNKTNEMIHDFSVYGDIAGKYIGAVKDTNYDEPSFDQRYSKRIGAAMSGVGKAMDQYSYASNLASSRQQLERVGLERGDITNTFSGDISGAIGRQLALTRGAYACDQYIASNGVGTTNFNVLSFMDVIFMRVTLNNVMLERFDNYFTHYGYVSGRCGIPRVCAFVNGSTNNDEIPHWLPVDGKPCTYIKTSDCRVTHSMLPVEVQIKAMFDSGVRMINGDPTTP